MEWERYEAMVRSVLHPVSPDTRLDRDTDLVECGLDSMGMVTLISALEDGFEVELPDDELRLDLFRRMGTPWELLTRLRNTGRV